MSYLDIAKEVFEIESNGVLHLSDNLDDDFSGVIESILVAKGRLIICGMGKSGIIGKKILSNELFNYWAFFRNEKIFKLFYSTKKFYKLSLCWSFSIRCCGNLAIKIG